MGARKNFIRAIGTGLFILTVTASSIFYTGCSKNEIIQPPESLGIYYGYPSEINHSNGNLEKAVNEFDKFDVLVFGATLEEHTHPEHEATKKIIDMLHNQVIPGEEAVRNEVYGYIDLGVTTYNHTLEEIAEKIDKWKDMGVDGIFYDDASSAYGVDESRLEQALRLVHNSQLDVMVNSDSIEWALATGHIKPGDGMLIEPFGYRLGERYSSYPDVVSLSKEYGVKFFGIGQYDSSLPLDKKQVQFQEVYNEAHELGLKAVGFTNPEYSAFGPEQNQLPFFRGIIL